MESFDPIVVVGMGGVFPGARDLRQFWNNILANRDMNRRVPPGRWIVDPDVTCAGDPSPDKVISLRGCFVDDWEFDPAGLNIDPDLLRRLDPLYHLTLRAGRQAFDDGVTDGLDRGRVGVILASIALPTDASSQITREILGSAFESRLFNETIESRLKTHPLNAQVTGLPAALLAEALGLGGGSYTLDAACASSLYAVKLACDELISGRADAMLAGGVSRPQCLYTQMGFSQLRALSASGRCAPFDQSADGLVVGEGAGLILLKRQSDAIRDGDHIYGVIRGIGLSNDIGGSLLAPDSEGQLRAMTAAYHQAGWSPGDVDLIECHGTGTPLGDAVEFRSLLALWENEPVSADQCPIGSIKSMIGHLLTAAGAAGLIKVLLAMESRTLPPSANYQSPSELITLNGSPFRVQDCPADWQKRDEHTPRRAAISAFGFGGINAHVLVEQWQDERMNQDPAIPRKKSCELQPARFNSERERLYRDGRPRGLKPAALLRTPEPIAIVGMAARFGNAASLPEYEAFLFRGESAFSKRPPNRWHGADDWVEQSMGVRYQKGAYLNDWAIPIGKYHLPPNEIPEILPQQLLMLEAVADALEDAGLPLHQRRQRAGVIVGMGLDFNATNHHLRWWLRGQARQWAERADLHLSSDELKRWIEALCDQAGPALNPTRTVGALGGIIASRIARECRFGGPSFAVSCDAASGLRSVEIAARSLQLGEMDMMVAGAVDLAGDVRSVLTSHALRHAGSADAEEPIGEGAAAVVLKRLSDARRDGDRVYAILRGIGAGGGAGIAANRADSPSRVTALTQAYQTSLERAYADAGILPESVSYVETHGSGDLRESHAEEMALSDFFSQRSEPLVVGSVTPVIGFGGVAAGIASFVKACLCLHRRILPPLRGVVRPSSAEPGVSVRLEMPDTPRPWRDDDLQGPRFCGVSAISITGDCMHLVLEGADTCASESQTDKKSSFSSRGHKENESKSGEIIVHVGASPPRPQWPLDSPPRHLGASTRQLVNPLGAPPLLGVGDGSRDSSTVSGTSLAVSTSTSLADDMVRASAATAAAHQAFLRFSNGASEATERLLTSQSRLLDYMEQRGVAHESPPLFPREMCMEFAVGSIACVLGPRFKEVDSYPVRVRLPGDPLMLVDRILSIHGEEASLSSGRIVTEHDVRPDAWYLDGGRCPISICVEAGQADLFLCAYLGIDLAVKGRRAYRLLDATVSFHRDLPRAGEVIHYEIFIDRFVRQGETYLFFFHYDATIAGDRVLSMRDGCAGFFTDEEIARSGGILITDRQDNAQQPENRPGPLVPMFVESYDDHQVAALRSGDLVGCFGSLFDGLNLRDPLRLPSGRMKLFDRVLEIDPKGGCYGQGLIRAEADIHPDDWFLTCHFVDDMTMPGTLMYECCAHALRFFLLRFGWVGERPGVCYQPILGNASALKCRGPVTPKTKKVIYQVEIQEMGYGPAPYVRADALMFADGRPVVEMKNMSMRVSGLDRDQIEATWTRQTTHAHRSNIQNSRGIQPARFNSASERLHRDGKPRRRQPVRINEKSESLHRDRSPRGLKPAALLNKPTAPLNEPGARRPAIYDHDRILAFAIGKPSEAFGEPYRVFDDERRIARLPGPPYQFLDRIVSIEPEPWKLVPGGWIEAEYDVPAEAWYFHANAQASMPFAVLLEVALQPCGWLAAYLGSALRSETDLSFRNLGGRATLHEEIFPNSGTMTTRVRLTNVSEAGGMIIEHFDMQIHCDGRLIYEGDTSFGFFSRQALAQQIGIRDAADRAFVPSSDQRARSKRMVLEDAPPWSPDDAESATATDGMSQHRCGLSLPGRAFRMIDTVEDFVQDGGPPGLGALRGSVTVDPQAWFFKAHFFQDPVWPGSLGLESFLQLLKVFARHRWESLRETHRFQPIILGAEHQWIYRGQIIPTNRHVEVEAVVTNIEEGDSPKVLANGFLKVDGIAIYEMIDFGLRLVKMRS